MAGSPESTPSQEPRVGIIDKVIVEAYDSSVSIMKHAVLGSLFVFASVVFTPRTALEIIRKEGIGAITRNYKTFYKNWS